MRTSPAMTVMTPLPLRVSLPTEKRFAAGADGRAVGNLISLSQQPAPFSRLNDDRNGSETMTETGEFPSHPVPRLQLGVLHLLQESLVWLDPRHMICGFQPTNSLPTTIC